MHRAEVRQAALELVAAGLNDCEVARRTGVARRTICDWRRARQGPRLPAEVCPRCWRPTKPIRLTSPDYSELLAMYLGDGSISIGARTARLRITLDSKYPAVIAETRALLSRCFPANGVGSVSRHGGTCVDLSVYNQHLECLFPQHAHGSKHLRRIELEDWQSQCIRAEPWPFIRGCIRTDGCSFINRTDIHRPQPYEYLSYQFANMSKDIVDLFVRACEGVGVMTRVNHSRRGLWDVRINRRASVALMDAHVGSKS